MTAARFLMADDPSDVVKLNAWLAELFQRHRVEATAQENLKLCLNEAVTNTVSYGFHGTAQPEIAVELEVTPTRLLATVTDNGMAFDPLEAAETKAITGLKDATIGGFGIKLMRESADAMAYARVAGRNVLTLTVSRDAERALRTRDR